MVCICHAVPVEVLERLAGDPELSDESRAAYRQAVKADRFLRGRRLEATRLARLSGPVADVELASRPSIMVFDCNSTLTLPGALVGAPQNSSDRTARRAFLGARAVAQFYKEVFGRNSVDGGGAALLSSIHYGVRRPNASWDGSRVLYGDGDGEALLDFTLGVDLIGHELTHGVTQHTLRIGMRYEPGAINESLSDVFGTMFRQWMANETVSAADWRFAADLIGPLERARGTRCIRDLSDPGASHCLTPQPSHYRQYRPAMDAHIASGIANRAFHHAAMKIGGRSWEGAGQIWYRAMTAGPRPNLNMRRFADMTRAAAAAMHGSGSSEAAAVTQSWSAVGL